MAAVDRISELPEPILHRILSFLSQKEAIQTSALSKTWRHVGPTRPKIELRESYFKKSSRASLLTVLGKTLQRYYHQNLSVNEFIFEMSPPEWESESDHQVIDAEFTNDPGKTLFKGLKRLSLKMVHINDETMGKIMLNCPLIEYLLVSRCVGLKTIPVTLFQAEFLTNLHISGPKFGRVSLIFTAPSSAELILIKRLKTLSLNRVYISEETLEKIMCSCPLIESLLLSDNVGLKNIRLKNNNNNLKHFTGSFCRGNTQSFAIHAPSTIESISIVKCPYWYGHDKYSFPRLKTLYLESIKLSAELFESISSNFPSLEELQLIDCYGFEEIQEINLTVCSIECLVIIGDSIKPIRATIYAPSIHYFKFSGQYPPQLIFNSETTWEWESDVDIWYANWLGNKDLNKPWLLELSQLLNSLRESQISLEVHSNPFKNLKVEDTNDAVFCNPVPLEHVNVKGDYESSSFPDLLSCLFLICRPRCIAMSLPTIKPATDLKREKDKLAEFMSRGGYLWERDLEEISMQVWDQNSQGWHTVGVEGTCFPGFTGIYPKIRFQVKWRD